MEWDVYLPACLREVRVRYWYRGETGHERGRGREPRVLGRERWSGTSRRYLDALYRCILDRTCEFGSSIKEDPEYLERLCVILALSKIAKTTLVGMIDSVIITRCWTAVCISDGLVGRERLPNDSTNPHKNLQPTHRHGKRSQIRLSHCSTSCKICLQRFSKW